MRKSTHNKNDIDKTLQADSVRYTKNMTQRCLILLYIYGPVEWQRTFCSAEHPIKYIYDSEGQFETDSKLWLNPIFLE